MSGNRSEMPTPRRLREARRRGEAPVSRDLTGAACLLAGLAAASSGAASLARLLAGAVATSLSEAVAPTGREPWPALMRALALLARTLTPIAGAGALGALATGLLQTRGLFSLEAVRFRLERLDPRRGLARLASAERLTTTALDAGKAVAALLIGWRLVASALPAAAAAPGLQPRVAARLLPALASRIALPLVAAMAAFGTLELALARRRQRRSLMMTRQEVARERREDEGEPRLRLERRRLHRALASSVPLRRATCLVVNPTHVAVALHHERSSDDAPHVVAKAMGPAAARLRAEARRAGVPIVQDVALARALFRLAEVGDEIPEELYEAAAALLVHVHGLVAEGRP